MHASRQSHPAAGTLRRRQPGATGQAPSAPGEGLRAHPERLAGRHVGSEQRLQARVQAAVDADTLRGLPIGRRQQARAGPHLAARDVQHDDRHTGGVLQGGRQPPAHDAACGQGRGAASRWPARRQLPGLGPPRGGGW